MGGVLVLAVGYRRYHGGAVSNISGSNWRNVKGGGLIVCYGAKGAAGGGQIIANGESSNYTNVSRGPHWLNCHSGSGGRWNKYFIRWSKCS